MCVAWNVDLEGNQGFQKCRLSHPEAAGSAGLQLQRPRLLPCPGDLWAGAQVLAAPIS